MGVCLLFFTYMRYPLSQTWKVWIILTSFKQLACKGNPYLWHKSKFVAYLCPFRAHEDICCIYLCELCCYFVIECCKNINPCFPMNSEKLNQRYIQLNKLYYKIKFEETYTNSFHLLFFQYKDTFVTIRHTHQTNWIYCAYRF